MQPLGTMVWKIKQYLERIPPHTRACELPESAHTTNTTLQLRCFSRRWIFGRWRAGGKGDVLQERQPRQHAATLHSLPETPSSYWEAEGGVGLCVTLV